jgi:two-component system sensor histidine kinase DegS
MDRLPASIEIALFRVMQEALTNVHRHARASTVKIDVERVQNEIILDIHDDGCGIPAETLRDLQESMGAGGVGIASMNERVRELRGVLQVESTEGTTVRATIPIDSEVSSSRAGKPTLAVVASA